MHEEAKALTKTLVWTVGMITQSTPENRERMALAGIQKGNGSARPRIKACFARSDTYRAADDVACVGWILTAIQERVNERDLPDWRSMRKVVRQSVKMLAIKPPTVH